MIVLLSANMTISKVRFHQVDLKVFFLILQIEFSIQNLLMQKPTMILCIF